MMAKKGFLLVLMNPPPAFEEEFNAWYDLEHVPERLSVPGFLTGLRYVSTGAAPRFLAIYDLEAPEVMDSSAYLRVAHDNSSPWTKRVTARARVQRHAGEQTYPGDRITGRAARVSVLRFRGIDGGAVEALTTSLRGIFEERPEVRQLRILVDPSVAEGNDVLAVVEARVPLPEPFDLSPLGAAADALDLVNTYTPF
jgi:hypothetical protein